MELGTQDDSTYVRWLNPYCSRAVARRSDSTHVGWLNHQKGCDIYVKHRFHPYRVVKSGFYRLSCEFEVEAENEEEARKFAEQLPVTSEDIIEDIRIEIIQNDYLIWRSICFIKRKVLFILLIESLKN